MGSRGSLATSQVRKRGVLPPNGDSSLEMPEDGWGDYELRPRERQIVTRAGGRARLWGWISITVGVAQVIVSLFSRETPSLLAYLPMGVIAIVIGVAFAGVGNALVEVNLSYGSSVRPLMRALDRLGTALTVQIVTTMVGVVLSLASIAVAALLFAASRLALGVH
jgi:hypothetical protein